MEEEQSCSNNLVQHQYQVEYKHNINMEVYEMERVFVNGELQLTDPNNTMTPQQVCDFYSSQYPELVTATVTGPNVKNDKIVYTFNSVVGTKG